MTFLLAAGAAQAAQAKPKPERVFRVAVLEAGPNWVHDKMLEALKQSLKTKGWGDRIEFPDDARKIGAWSPGGRTATPFLAAKLMHREDIDLIIGMGTEATLALLANNNGKTPVIAMTLSDPVGAGVVKSEKDSGVANLTTCIVPNKWVSMLRLFYDVVHFKKLGVMYQDTKPGRTYTSLEDARDVAREKGAALLEYGRLEAGADAKQCLKGLDWLIGQGMDAFFIPDVPCFDWTVSDPRPLFDRLAKGKVATFARSGLPLVQLGALMGSCSFDMNPLGGFHAQQMVAIFQGAVPRKLSMLMKDDLGLSLNLETAKKLGRDFTADELVSADVIAVRSQDLQSVRKWY